MRIPPGGGGRPMEGPALARGRPLPPSAVSFFCELITQYVYVVWVVGFIKLHTEKFMLIFIVWPSLKLRSSLGLAATPSTDSFSISLLCLTHLKWSCRATLRSKLSERSANPMPMNAALPESS